ncbi:MAG: TrmB family transcriptional regulator [Halobacteriota archaeon]
MGQDITLTAQEVELIRVLKAHGLSERAARMYVTLMRGGSKTATELADTLRTNRMAIYRCAEDLMSQGLVTISLRTPTRYAAAPIDTVIDMLINERAREMATLHLMRGGRVSRVRHDVASDGALTFQVVKDTARGMAVAKQLIQQASERVTFAVGADEVLLAYRAGLVDACQDALRTLDARGVTDITSSNCTLIAKTLKGVPSIELRHVERYRGLQYLTVDGKNSLVGIAPDPRAAERVKPKGAFLYVMSDAFAQSLDVTFAYVWNDAMNATSRLDELAEDT